DEVVPPPFGLRVRVVAADGVVLVALQGTGDAEVVDEAATPLGHPLVIETQRDVERRSAEIHAVRPSRGRATKVAVEIDDGARGGRHVLRDERNREVLCDLP